jgi:hypothetical protein
MLLISHVTTTNVALFWPMLNGIGINMVRSSKRKQSTRVLENADPLLPKNKKTKTFSRTTLPVARHIPENADASGPSSRKSSVGIEEVDDEECNSIVLSMQPTDPARILEPADGSDDEVEAPVEEPEEDAESELSKSPVVLYRVASA